VTAPPDRGAVLDARGLTVDRGGRTVVDGVDLSLGRGQVLALLGPNGAGKSTLVAGLAGLVRRAAGEVRVEGRLTAAIQAPARARRSARANVEAGLAWWGVPRAERRTRAEAALRRLAAGHLSGRSAPTLSGGEARRVHLARALAVEADVVLLDEPFAGLDPRARADLLHDLSGALRDPRGGTLVVVHDRTEAWALADRVAVMIAGRIVAEGSPQEVFDNPASAELAEFLGYEGRLRRGGRTLFTRPAQIALDPAGELTATVRRRIPMEDEVRVELDTAEGPLVARADPPGPDEGDSVRVRIRGGVWIADRDELSRRRARPSPTSPSPAPSP
jgi:ABC-type sulfate/molybdate transport systems ATPase subunit